MRLAQEDRGTADVAMELEMLRAEVAEWKRRCEELEMVQLTNQTDVGKLRGG